MYGKIAGPLRIQSNGATTLTYELDALSGGSRCKVILFSVRVLRASANCSLGLQISQGPDGESYGPSTDVIPLASVPSGGGAQQGSTGTPDSNAADVLNEWIRPELRCGVSSGSADEWAVVEVYAYPVRPSAPSRYVSPMQSRRDARPASRPSTRQASTRHTSAGHSSLSNAKSSGCSGGCNG